MSVPVLNLVDKIFQLKKRGWLRYAARSRCSVIFKSVTDKKKVVSVLSKMFSLVPICRNFFWWCCFMCFSRLQVILIYNVIFVCC